MQETVQRKKSALRTMLEMMDVPEMRMDVDKQANLRWLNRNLRIRNGDHPLFETAIELVGWLMTFNAGQAMLTRKRPVC